MVKTTKVKYILDFSEYTFSSAFKNLIRSGPYVGK